MKSCATLIQRRFEVCWELPEPELVSLFILCNFLSLGIKLFVSVHYKRARRRREQRIKGHLSYNQSMAALDASSNIKEAEEVAQLLSEAINYRDKEEATKCLEQLLDLKLPVCVKLRPEAYCQEAIRLRVGVADMMSDVCIPITLMVPVYMTISELKEKISKDYGFHPAVQRWVIRKRLAQDRDTLFQYGVNKHNDSAFLFVLTAKAAHLSHEQEKRDKEEKLIDDIIENIELLDVAAARPPDVRPKENIPLPPKPQPTVWSCPECTYENKPTRPGCEMCSTARPENYKVPDVYKPDEEEIRRLQQEELASLQYQQVS